MHGQDFEIPEAAMVPKNVSYEATDISKSGSGLIL